MVKSIWTSENEDSMVPTQNPTFSVDWPPTRSTISLMYGKMMK